MVARRQRGPAQGDTIGPMKITDGIHRLGIGMINSYLVADGGGVTIIDAGLPGYWSALPGELAAMGHSLADVRAIVLTHGHSDHLGFAERARRTRGLPVSVHALDALLAQGKVPNPAKGTGTVRAIPLLRFIALSMRLGGWHIDRLKEVVTFGDGATLDVPGSPRVILVPGHTPGNVALHVAGHDALFVGDALATYAVTTGSSGPQLAPFTADAGQALASLDRLAGIEARWLLPGHGQPWTGGTAAAIAAARESAAAATLGRR
jgi:glyoxylase-like metal-dependent hydrolase (beta-lactamase superfamily II)